MSEETVAKTVNQYDAMKERHTKELSDFPVKYAFGKEQFEEAMRSLGLEPTDTDKVVSTPCGGIVRKTDAIAYRDLFKRWDKEQEDAITADTTGDGFIFDMFDSELSNHEFTYTWEIEPTIDALGYTLENINASPALIPGLRKAIQSQKEWNEKHN